MPAGRPNNGAHSPELPKAKHPKGKHMDGQMPPRFKQNCMNRGWSWRELPDLSDWQKLQFEF